MQEIIVMVMDKFGYIGIMLLVTVENLFPPIPSEVILTFGGFMTTYSKMNILGVIVASTIGSVIGAIILYLVGRILDKEKIEKLVEGKVGKILRFKRADIEKADAWFNKRGKATVFFCRFIPIVRSLISIPAGMTGMKFTPFIVLTTLGSVIWNTVLVYLGFWAGDSWEKIAGYIDSYSDITLVVLVITFVLAVFLFYRQRLKKNTTK